MGLLFQVFVLAWVWILLCNTYVDSITTKNSFTITGYSTTIIYGCKTLRYFLREDYVIAVSRAGLR